MTRNLTPAALALGLLVACDTTVTLPASRLSEPVALVTATRFTGQDKAPVVFVANATNDDLRAFYPTTGLFARGPNAISPLSIDVGFRPTRLAAGQVVDAGAKYGFVAVAGASRQVALVDAQKLVRTRAAADTCTGASVSPSCLPAPATGVAAAGAQVFAALAPTGAPGSFLLASFVVTVEQGVPVLSLAGTTTQAGQPGGLAVLPDGSKVYVADQSAARVLEVTTAGGAARVLAVAGPVTDVALSPRWVDGSGVHPEGEFVLALLADGRLQTLDPAKGGPAADPTTPTLDIAPLSLVTPIRSISFVPACDPEALSPCQVELRLSTTETRKIDGLGFVGLGDGTAMAIAPDPAHRQLYRPVVRTEGTAAVSPSKVTLPGSTSTPTTPTLESALVTTGFTRTEVWRLTFQGELPGYVGRPATLTQGTSGLELRDDQPGAFVSGVVLAHDSATVVPLGPACAALAGGTTADVVAVSADTLGLAAPSANLAGCLPLRVSYRVRAADTTPWTVVGSASGFVGRAGMGPDVATAPLFTYAGQRFLYPPLPAPDGPALQFMIVGPSPVVPDSSFTISTASGFDPFLLGTEGIGTTGGGLANAVTTTVDRLYIAQVGSNRLVQVAFGNIGNANAVQVF